MIEEHCTATIEDFRVDYKPARIGCQVKHVGPVDHTTIHKAEVPQPGWPPMLVQWSERGGTNWTGWAPLIPPTPPTYSFDHAFARGQAECSECGAVVSNKDTHTAWHAKE